MPVLAGPIKRNKHDIWIAAQEQTHPSVASRSNDFKGSKAPNSPAAIGFAQKLIQGFRKLSFSRLSVTNNSWFVHSRGYERSRSR